MKTIMVSHRFHRQAKLALLGILILVSAMQLGSAIFWKPAQKRFDEQKALMAQLDEALQLSRRAENAAGFSLGIQESALSGDPTLVAHRYHEWLLKHAAKAGEVSVSPLPAVKHGTIGHLVTFQIEGNTDIPWLSDFIDQVERTPLLHRITYLNINHHSPDSIHFSCKLDALAVSGAATKTKWPSINPQSAEPSLARFLEERKPFERGYRGSEPAKTMVSKQEVVQEPIAEPVQIDPFETLKLIGSVSFQGQAQIWIVDSRTNQEIFVPENGQFAFAAQQFEIKSISPDFVELISSDQHLRWPLGATLRSVLN